MHEHMTLHAHSNPLPTHSRPAHTTKTVGTVGDCFDKATTGDCPDAAPIYSVKEVVGKFKRMLKLWGGQENYPFSLKCNSGGEHSTRGE